MNNKTTMIRFIGLLLLASGYITSTQAGIITWNFTGTSACSEGLGSGNLGSATPNCTAAVHTLSMDALTIRKKENGKFTNKFKNSSLTQNKFRGLG